MKTAFAIALTALGVAQLFAGPERAAPHMAAPHLNAMSHPQVELQPRVAPEPRVEAAPNLDESRRDREMEAPPEKMWAERPRLPEASSDGLIQVHPRLQDELRMQEQRQMQVQPRPLEQTTEQRLSFAEARERMPRERHDRAWWEQRYNGIFRAGTGYYFLDAGYWYPAFGYDPEVDTYASEDPIYAIAALTPDQEIATVQTALLGVRYYNGSITGALDTTTLEAIAKFQTDNGLLASGAIDQPTLEALGLS